MTPSTNSHQNQGPIAALRNYRYAIITLVTLSVGLLALNAWLTPGQEPDSTAILPVLAQARAIPPESPPISPEPDASAEAPGAELASHDTPEPPDCTDPPVERFHELPVGRLPYALLAVDAGKNPPVAYIQPARGNAVLMVEVGAALPDDRVLAWAGPEGVILCDDGRWQRMDHPLTDDDSLAGAWRVTLSAAGGHAEELAWVGISETQGGQFAMPVPLLPSGALEGQRTGTALEVDMMEETTIQTGDGLEVRVVFTSKLHGETSAGLSRFQLSGSYIEEIPTQDGSRHDIPVTIQAERLTPLDMAKVKYHASARQRMGEAMDSLRDDLNAYIEKHGQLPATMDELLSMFAEAPPAVRRALENDLVHYEPNALQQAPAEFLPAEAAGDPDAIYAYEVDMVRRYGADAPMPQTVMEFRITETGERAGISVFPHGGLSTWQRPGEQDATPQSDQYWSVVRAQSQNHLKQLGLMVKMFEHGHNGYTPGGWWSVYPEYLTDLTVLTHPVDDPGTVSYQYMAPVMNFQHLFESTRTPETRENPAALHQFMSELPIVIERQPYGQPPGRNVLFADGHVEWMPEQTYQERAREWFP